MSKAKSLARATYSVAYSQAEWASGAIVVGCAIALILAGQPLPL